MAWADWTPDVLGTGGAPDKGSSPVQVGRWNELADGSITGWGLIRFGNGMRRGQGTYRLTLPATFRDTDPSGFTIIGTALIGWATRAGFPAHRTCTLHLCGTAGFSADDRAVMAPDGGGFVGDSFPAGGVGGRLANIHFRFHGEKAA
jgi:hypothetical protein